MGQVMRGLLRSFAGWYGANPLHLLALIGCFALAGYAADRLIADRPLAVIVWFVGAAIGHDLVLLPLYQLADAPLDRIGRRESPAVSAPWINYVRIPAGLSGLLFLVWFPSILRLSDIYGITTHLSSSGYLSRWLATTGALFLLSALAYAIRLRRRNRTGLARN